MLHCRHDNIHLIASHQNRHLIKITCNHSSRSSLSTVNNFIFCLIYVLASLLSLTCRLYIAYLTTNYHRSTISYYSHIYTHTHSRTDLLSEYVHVVSHFAVADLVVTARPIITATHLPRCTSIPHSCSCCCTRDAALWFSLFSIVILQIFHFVKRSLCLVDLSTATRHFKLLYSSRRVSERCNYEQQLTPGVPHRKYLMT